MIVVFSPDGVVSIIFCSTYYDTECTELRSLLKQEQSLSTEALVKLKTINSSSSATVDEISRDFKTKVSHKTILIYN